MDTILGQVVAFSFNWAPIGWLPCNGQLLPISQYQDLHSLIGNVYGGDGTTTFGLPNLNGKTAIGQGGTYTTGQTGGNTSITLTTAQMPAHTHPVNGGNTSLGKINVSAKPGTLNSPAAGGNSSFGLPITADSRDSVLAFNDDPYPNLPVNISVNGSATIGPSGGGQAINILPPYLVLNFCIATTGIYPQRP